MVLRRPLDAVNDQNFDGPFGRFEIQPKLFFGKGWKVITKGQRVYIRPEFQHPGEETLTFLAVENEEGGRVRIEAQLGLPINPQQVVETIMLEPGQEAVDANE